MRRGYSVSDFLQPLADKPVQAYLTDVLQVADVVEWCLSQMVGDVTMYQTSFSISEEFLRRLFHLRESKQVRDIHLVLDHKALEKTLRIQPFLKQTIEHVYLAKNHSKVILLRPSSGNGVAIVTSQNLTRGNRYESALVTTDKDVFQMLLLQVTDVINNASYPFKFD